MQVNCPNCHAKVPAEHINIQKMVAVCPSCDHIFPFELPETKSKRRKIKQPEKLTLHDTEHLHMEFWTNFRLDRSEAFISSVVGIIISLLGVLLLGVEGIPFFISLGSLLLAVILFYWLALMVVNKTHIEMDDQTIKVSRQPLPSLASQKQEVNLSGVIAIRYEETAISKKEAYDTPRYRVWAETADGTRRTIVNDVTEEYAIFIAQRMEEYLHRDDAELDTTHLEDHAYEEMNMENIVPERMLSNRSK